MIGRRVANFERFILTPLNFLLPIASLVYFFQKAWLVGAYLLLAWFCIGLIGQSIHKDKTFYELARGGMTAEENIRKEPDPRRDAHDLAKPVLYVSWLAGITTAVMLFHYDYRWFASFPIGLAVGIVTPMALALIFARPAG